MSNGGAAKKINIAIVDERCGGKEYGAEARDIDKIFQIAENVPDWWADMGIDKFMGDFADKLKIASGKRQSG